eukprot:Skav235266  [mRNA]  locus=scaffold874:164204:166912:+ [translate_table: standard]
MEGAELHVLVVGAGLGTNAGPEGYLGNAGFVYGVLLKDPKLRVDMLQHAVTEAHQNWTQGRAAVNGAGDARADKHAVREAASKGEQACVILRYLAVRCLADLVTAAQVVPRLVLTSHGSEVSAQLRKAAVRALASQDGEV